MVKPFISVRKSIKWGNDAPFENTDTVVLTSPKRFYVDIRILKSAKSEPIQSMTKDGLHQGNLLKYTETPEIEWAFCGTSVSTSGKDGGPSHTVWTHWVDSRTGETDEGFMWDLPSGDVFEKGSMAHPETGEVTAYEEIWRDVELEAASSGVVMKVEKGDVKGMYVEIDQTAQGILLISGRIVFARWYGKGDGSRMLAVGSDKEIAMFPSEHCVESEGEAFEAGGLEWVCVERF